MQSTSAPRLIVSKSSSCWSCTLAMRSRPFSTLSPQQAVGPEHPKYIDIPKAPQPDFETRQRLKGILPVPRTLFNPVTGSQKVTPEYLGKTTKEPSQAKSPRGPNAERLLWKQRLAETRRKNLRSGLQELYQRKEETDLRVVERTTRRQAKNQELVSRPERDDEILTSASVDLPLKMLMNGKLSVLRVENLKRKQAGVRRLEKRKTDEQKDALHTLYMQARNFITTEAQLDEAVERVFGTPEKPAMFEGEAVTSVWDVKSGTKPPSVQDLLNQENARNATAMFSGAGFSDPARQRLKKIAEELTGGKI
ncbi:hypothetical protein M501DRAFT_996143 [Patellaria atrata CBS 101060]|uniref:Uncharacterized protein n=1 Tax=Patellaria atrata CBS 101060 TaxID=1346257 RepID=A0A9P4VP74_9PEZI|nr:hypothetical protein M501DRAFT_996143 [Patellaria atrata CBS 101060]